MAESLYWIWLSMALGAGNSVYLGLLEKLGTPFEIYRASEEELLRALTPAAADEGERANYYEKTLRADKIAALLANKNLENAYKIIDYCSVRGYGILTYDNPRYPARLRQLRNPPAMLYFRGQLPDFERRVCVAMVGTRSMSDYGREIGYSVAYELAAAGAVVVSGMALGVDGVCASAALAAGGTTAAVLGCGIDVTYPHEHGRLMSGIERSGVVLTEYAPATPPDGRHFPVRNRIISGLCQATLVVEADLRSGALITAREALHQGRELYAIPGKLNDAGSAGTNNLIIDGAQMVRSASDILKNYKYLYSEALDFKRLSEAEMRSRFNEEVIRYYGVSWRTEPRAPAAIPQNRAGSAAKSNTPPLHGKPTEKFSVTPPSALKVSAPAPRFASTPKPTEPPRREITFANETQQTVYGLIPPGQAISADEIIRAGLSVPEVTMALTMLEIQGHISSMPGGLYIRK